MTTLEQRVEALERKYAAFISSQIDNLANTPDWYSDAEQIVKLTAGCFGITEAEIHDKGLKFAAASARYVVIAAIQVVLPTLRYREINDFMACDRSMVYVANKRVQESRYLQGVVTEVVGAFREAQG